ncbi:hypothetical protein [Undibacterium sp. Tian12W]|uniref:hypothetical protein n=1 Tax=Undibacterium sp. Tian12W TaxID=3413054 RepID=UPI003BF1B96E
MYTVCIAYPTSVALDVMAVLAPVASALPLPWAEDTKLYAQAISTGDTACRETIFVDEQCHTCGITWP